MWIKFLTPKGFVSRKTEEKPAGCLLCVLSPQYYGLCVFEVYSP